jgi:anti-sigma factor RsiW
MIAHDELRELLPLAAADGLSPAEEDRVALHIRSCAACAAELESWRLLAGGLRRLPTPQPSPAVVARARARAEERLTQSAENRWQRNVLVFLTLFAWTVTLASWPVFRLVSGGLLSLLDPQLNQAWIRFAGFATFAWLAGGAAAVLLALHRRGERRLA